METIHGVFEWIPVEENGPTMGTDSHRLMAFAYVDQPDESAILVHGVPPFGSFGEVTARWCDGYPTLTTRPGDTITLLASQRPIARITVTD